MALLGTPLSFLFQTHLNIVTGPYMPTCYKDRIVLEYFLSQIKTLGKFKGFCNGPIHAHMINLGQFQSFSQITSQQGVKGILADPHVHMLVSQGLLNYARLYQKNLVNQVINICKDQVKSACNKVTPNSLKHWHTFTHSHTKVTSHSHSFHLEM